MKKMNILLRMRWRFYAWLYGIAMRSKKLTDYQKAVLHLGKNRLIMKFSLEGYDVENIKQYFKKHDERLSTFVIANACMISLLGLGK